uniref:Uncharacterized protein n=1 Tax=Chromera velia CCMP2878 TaxID=1169474 RepID=A0A0G4FQ78_9ALVE|eukprot:Cvel_18228.t1-p1 / transcript=Cvel_18228.t1 / gene=Cvel_18228 / organism=Chromera_velia_CCMP2878 / gene_product=hypothetical protein / transcript_product=hypothetical protein / location=Cvel_scaffold1498:10122-22530(+) / protein_length=1569 / sequence_SO=supercontig / SO=protein_coding / is_pseudo=false
MGDGKQNNKKKDVREHRRADPPSGQSAGGGCSGSVGMNFSDGSRKGTEASVSLQGDGPLQSWGMPGLFSSSSTQTGGPAFLPSVSEEAEDKRRSRITNITPRLFSPRASSSPLTTTRSRAREEGQETETGQGTEREIGHGKGRQDRGRFLSDEMEGRRRPAATVPCGRIFTRQRRCRGETSRTEGEEKEAAHSSPPTHRRDRDTARLSREETGIFAGLGEGGGGKRNSSAIRSPLPAAACLSDSGRGGSNQVGDGGSDAATQAHGEEQKEDEENDNFHVLGDSREEHDLSAPLLFLPGDLEEEEEEEEEEGDCRDHGVEKRLFGECGGASVGNGGIPKERCPHGRKKYFCKDCGGQGICKHGRFKFNCRECGASSFCEHGRKKYFCKDSGGKGSCDHKHNKHYCKECGGKGICQHGRTKYHCTICTEGRLPGCRERKRNENKERSLSQGPSHLLSGLPPRVRLSEEGEHFEVTGGEILGPPEGEERKDGEGTENGEERHGGERGERKREAAGGKRSGKGGCPHGRKKYDCKECGGKGICEHGRKKYYCKECGGKGICEHGHRKQQCKECGGKGICEHGHRKSRCKECGGGSGRLCMHEQCRGEKDERERSDPPPPSQHDSSSSSVPSSSSLPFQPSRRAGPLPYATPILSLTLPQLGGQGGGCCGDSGASPARPPAETLKDAPAEARPQVSVSPSLRAPTDHQISGERQSEGEGMECPPSASRLPDPLPAAAGEEGGQCPSALPSRPRRTAALFPPPTTRASARAKQQKHLGGEGMQTGGRREGLRLRRSKEGVEEGKDCQHSLIGVNANRFLFRQTSSHFLPKKLRGTTLQSGDGDPFEIPALDSPLYDDRFTYPRIRCEGEKEEIGLLETDIDDAIPMPPPHTEAFFDSEKMLNEQGGGFWRGGGGGGQPSVSPSPLPSPSQVPSLVLSSRSKATKKQKEEEERDAGKGGAIEEEIDHGEDGGGASASSSSSSSASPSSFLSPNRVEEERGERNEFCEHGLEKRLCAHCGEKSVRKEGKEGGEVLCPHRRNKYFCKHCGGIGSCNHKHNRSNCKECGPDGFCMHGRRRRKCKECRGLCRHGRKKDFCALCGGAEMILPECNHGLPPSLCQECSAAKRHPPDLPALPRYPHDPLGVSNPCLPQEEQDNRKKNLKKRSAVQEVRGNEKKARGDAETGENANEATESHSSNSHTNSRKSNLMAESLGKEIDKEKGDTSAVHQKRKRGREAAPPPSTAPDPSLSPRQFPVSPAGPAEPIPLAGSQSQQQTGLAASVAPALVPNEMVIWQASEETGRRFLGRVIRAHSRRNQIEVHVWGSPEEGLLRNRVFSPMWQSRDGTRPVYRHDRPPCHRPYTCIVPLHNVVERGMSLTQDSKLPPSSVSAHRAAFSQIGEAGQEPLHERGGEQEVERSGGEKRRRKEASGERETHTQKRKTEAGTAETENLLGKRQRTRPTAKALTPKEGEGPTEKKKVPKEVKNLVLFGWWKLTGNSQSLCFKTESMSPEEETRMHARAFWLIWRTMGSLSAALINSLLQLRLHDREIFDTDKGNLLHQVIVCHEVAAAECVEASE